MRVIIANDNAVISGGATKVALTSAKGLAERGTQVEFVHGHPGVEDGYERIENLSFRCLKSPVLKMGVTDLIRVSFSKPVYEQVQKIILEGQLDNTVLHLHLWKTALSPSVAKAATDLGVPVIVTFHDYHVACPQGQFFNNQRNEVCSKKPGSAGCIFSHCSKSKTIFPKWAEVYRYYIQRYFAGLPNKLIYFNLISQLSEEIIAPYLPQKASIHRILNPIDVAKTQAVDLGLNSAILFSGRLSAEKCPELLLKAAIETNTSVVFAGDGPLRQILESYNYPNASFTGWLSAEDLEDRINQSRALCIPSIWYEVDPVAPLEALARGVPVITSDVCASKDQIKNLETGTIFKNNSVESLSNALNLVSTGSGIEFGRRAYDEYWNHPRSIERHVSESLDVYQQMLSRHPN
jgi:glycosyltransferase involved in cell wall biosynthesis